jgi:ketopantoate reductase
MTKRPIIIVGMGEMAGVFARGFLRAGYPVYPVTREMNMQQQAAQIANPQLVLVAVAENDLHPVLQNLPEAWKDQLVLLQNELLPADWQQYQLEPTVISVWFEKKKGQDFKVLIPSPVYGDKADILVDALQSIGIAARKLDNPGQLLFELVVKNVYILTTNIAGLKTGGTVSELWQNHRPLATAVAAEIIQLQQKLAGQTFEQDKLIDAMLQAFDGDPDHNCMGRSAPARLQRALKLAQHYQLQLPTLQQIAADTAQ